MYNYIDDFKNLRLNYNNVVDYLDPTKPFFAKYKEWHIFSLRNLYHRTPSIIKKTLNWDNEIIFTYNNIKAGEYKNWVIYIGKNFSWFRDGINNYTKVKYGISLDNYATELKKWNIKKKIVKSFRITDDITLFIKYLKKAQEKSNIAKQEVYNKWDCNRILERIYDNWLWKRRDEEVLFFEKISKNIDNAYRSKWIQIKYAIKKSIKIWIKPIISLDSKGLPIIYFETPKWQISFHIPQYWESDFNTFGKISELKNFLPNDILKNVKMVDNYEWSWLNNSEDIINSLVKDDFKNFVYN